MVARGSPLECDDQREDEISTSRRFGRIAFLALFCLAVVIMPDAFGLRAARIFQLLSIHPPIAGAKVRWWWRRCL